MSKYIDLLPTMLAEMPAYETDIRRVLKWLDEHPDQAPGRTITRSEYRDTLNGAVKVSGYGDDWERGFSTGIIVAGAKVVPDPEPTNAEKWDSFLCAAIDRNPMWNIETIAAALDKAGVKAPGGDDER